MKSAILIFIFLTFGFSLAHAEITCHECGAEWPDDANFCGLCGAPLLRHKVVKTGDTLYLIDLIESGRWAEYGEMIEFSGCSIDEGILTIGGNGYLKVAVGDRSWRDYEISGKFFLIDSNDNDERYLFIITHNDPREKQYGNYGREMIFVKDGHDLKLYDLVGLESIEPAFDLVSTWGLGSPKYGWVPGKFDNDKKSQKGPNLKHEVWYDFRIVAEGFSITMYVDGEEKLYSDDLSCQTGGFSLESYQYIVYFKDLKVKINRMGD